MDQTRKPRILNGTRFVIAKYAPDLIRMEPRNIGIIVWTPTGVTARFLGEENGRISKPPAHVGIQSINAYRQWVKYWRMRLEAGLRKRSGEFLTPKDPEFLEELQGESRDNYLLVDGGFLMSDAHGLDIEQAADELFSHIVEPTATSTKNDAHREAERTLKQSSALAVQQAGLTDRNDYHKNFELHCPVEGTQQHFTFEHALHSANTEVVIAQIPLWRMKDVQSAAFRFQCMRLAEKYASTRRAALVYATEDDLKSADVQESIRMMKNLSRVINVSNVERAVGELSEIAI